MNDPEIRVKFERLKSPHDTGPFTSSDAEMNTWLKTQALVAQYAGDLYTTVAVVPGSPVVVGYMAICRYQILPVDHPPLVNAPEPTVPVPGVLLSHLAVDVTREGRGIGTALLMLAMKQAAVRAIADTVTDEQRSLGVVIPTMFTAGLHAEVARAVSTAWTRSGSSPTTPPL